jgi:hypothetical protein
LLASSNDVVAVDSIMSGVDQAQLGHDKDIHQNLPAAQQRQWCSMPVVVYKGSCTQQHMQLLQPQWKEQHNSHSTA